MNCMKTSQLLVQACPETVLRDELSAVRHRELACILGSHPPHVQVPELHSKAISLLLHSKVSPGLSGILSGHASHARKHPAMTPIVL